MEALVERVANVQLLLETLDDPYPTPRSALATESGPSPSRYVPCETCRQRGWVRMRSGDRLCLVCDGRGWHRREGASPAWDAYLGMPVDEAMDLPVDAVHIPVGAAQAFARDREEERSGRYWQLAHSWERRKVFYDRHGSYVELRRGLVRLQGEAPRRARLLRSVHVEHQPRQLTERDRVDIALGVLQLALWMRTVRVPRFLVERAQAERNVTVLALAAVGMKSGEIAVRLELPKDTVKRVLRRQKQRANANGRGIPRPLHVA